MNSFTGWRKVPITYNGDLGELRLTELARIIFNDLLYKQNRAAYYQWEGWRWLSASNAQQSFSLDQGFSLTGIGCHACHQSPTAFLSCALLTLA